MVHGTPEAQLAAVADALDRGINHFDTAAFYGYGASELYLGQALRATGARDVLVTTKVAIGREPLESGRIRPAVRQSVDQSLSRLRRDVIDILLLHNAPNRARKAYDPAFNGPRVAEVMNTYLPRLTFDDITGDDGVLEEVDRLIAEGKVRSFGLSGQDNDPLVMRALIDTGRIAIFNQTYNLLNPSAAFAAARAGQRMTGGFAAAQAELFVEFENIIDYARDAGVAVSVISALAAGALTDAALAGTPPAPFARRANRFPFEGEFERNVALARRFEPIAEEAGLTLTELAAAFVLSTPGVTTLVAGISSADQIASFCRATERAPLDPGMIARFATIWLGD
jgi:aryl-alcohol dehydrogenase-like predicted oxidoreductase